MHARARIASALLATAASLGVGLAAPTAQADPVSATGAAASYRGARIDLARGWHGARTCAVDADRQVRCYATHRAADRAVGYDPRTDPLYRSGRYSLANLPACASGWVCLWDGKNGTGRRLIFNDEYWHNLNEYGFSDKTSSWRNNQSRNDSAHLARDEGGHGGQIALWGAGNYSADLGAYDNWASSVHG